VPVLTLLCKDAVPAGATLHRSLQDGGSITAATTTTGWNPGTNAVGQSCLMVGGTEVARTAGTWGTTLQPSAAPSTTLGDCWRTENPYTGNFASGNWVFTFGFRSVTAAYTGRFRLAIRIWRSPNQNGSGAVELTSGRVVSAATAASLTTTTDTTLTCTWAPGAGVTLAGQYLFVSVGIEVTTLGGGTTQDVDFRVDSASSYGLVTPNFTAGLTVAPGVGAIVATGNAPVALRGSIVRPGTGAAAFSGPSVADSFDRANASPAGGNWITLPGFAAVAVASNQLRAAAAVGEAVAYYNTSLPADQYCQFRIVTNNPNALGVMCRINPATGDGYLLAIISSALQWYKRVGNSWLNITTNITRTNSVGDVVRLEVRGTTLTALVNGAVVGSITDGSITATGYAGVYDDYQTVNGVLDDFEAGALDALIPAGVLTALEQPGVGAAAVTGLAPSVTVSATSTPTRFYFSSFTSVPVTPAYSAWDRTAEATRGLMLPWPDDSASSALLAGGTTNIGPDGTFLFRQYVSDQMAAGIAFSTSDTIKAQVVCAELSVGNNINRTPVCVKVYSRDGLTLRATLKALGHYGPTTNEWPLFASAINKSVLDSDPLDTNYTTVAGDRLVVEFGGQVDATGGTAVIGGQFTGARVAESDLGENESDTNTSSRAWFEISRKIVFENTLVQQGSIAVAGLAPIATVSAAPLVVTPGVGAIVATGLAPPTDRVGQVSWIQFTIPAAVPSAPGTVAPGVGAVVVAGQPPALLRGSVIAAGLGSVVVTGLAPVVVQTLLEQPGAGAVVVAGQAPTRVAGAVVQPATGAVAVVGLARVSASSRWRALHRRRKSVSSRNRALARLRSLGLRRSLSAGRSHNRVSAVLSLPVRRQRSRRCYSSNPRSARSLSLGSHQRYRSALSRSRASAASRSLDRRRLRCGVRWRSRASARSRLLGSHRRRFRRYSSSPPPAAWSLPGSHPLRSAARLPLSLRALSSSPGFHPPQSSARSLSRARAPL